MNTKRVVIIGGGAAGFFAAINLAEQNSNMQITLLEKGKDVLQKVKISGGGRCNITHHCLDAEELSKHYPRGERALRGPFRAFGPRETIAWFESRGLPLKTEADGRMFPQSNSSQSVVDCLQGEAKRLGVELLCSQGVKNISYRAEQAEPFLLETSAGQEFSASLLMLAGGSSKQLWKLIEGLGHSIVEPVPSLFTFHIKHPLLSGLQGLSLPHARLKLGQKKKAISSEGALLITHWGLSGPAALRLSAWGARALAELDYQCSIRLCSLPLESRESLQALQDRLRREQGGKQIKNACPFMQFPQRYWHRLLELAEIPQERVWGELSKAEWRNLLELLLDIELPVQGKSTFKEEFVTAGGVKLKEIDFTRFESKKIPGLFFAGEVLDIDAITGGFNFQAAWTGAYLAAQAMAQS